MQDTTIYHSPMGRILLAGDEKGLMGTWFEGQKYYGNGLGEEAGEREVPVLYEAKRWLDVYFSGQEPDFYPDLHLVGTPFQREVWEILRAIPYGETITYGEIAQLLARKKGLSHMSAQAVGGAVGHNKISILIPCHRVVGSDGSLTGYAGGVEKKMNLLTLEGVDVGRFYCPKKGTAL